MRVDLPQMATYFVNTALGHLLVGAARTRIAFESRGQGRTGKVLSGDLFKVTNVWTVHLKFTADNEQMEPKVGGPAVRWRSRGLRAGEAGRWRIRPRNVLHQPFSIMDQDRRCFRRNSARCRKWFTDWDKDKQGNLMKTVRGWLNYPGPPRWRPPGTGRGRRMPDSICRGGGTGNASSAAGIEFKYACGFELMGTFKDVGVRIWQRHLCNRAALSNVAKSSPE
jgi:hypothetical protein